ASAGYILFLDPDDCLAENAAETLYAESIKCFPEIIFYDVQSIPKESKLIKKISNPKKNKSQNIIKSVFLDVKKPAVATPGKMYAKDLVIKTYEKLSFIKERLVYAEDLVFLFTASALADSYSTLNLSLYRYHTNPESISASKSKEALDLISDQIDSVIEILTLLSLDDELIERNSDNLFRAKEKMVGHLSAEKHYLRRHLVEEDTGRELYLDSLLNAYKPQKNLKHLIRMLIYTCTFSKIKL